MICFAVDAATPWLRGRRFAPNAAAPRPRLSRPFPDSSSSSRLTPERSVSLASSGSFMPALPCWWVCRDGLLSCSHVGRLRQLDAWSHAAAVHEPFSAAILLGHSCRPGRAGGLRRLGTDGAYAMGEDCGHRCRHPEPDQVSLRHRARHLDPGHAPRLPQFHALRAAVGAALSS